MWNYDCDHSIEIHFIEPDTKAISLISAARFPLVRMDFIATDYVDGVSPTFDWSGYDSLYAALQKVGINPIFITPDSKLSEINLALYAPFCKLAAARYPKALWVGYNEMRGAKPFVDSNGLPDPAKAVAFLNAVGPAIKAGNPNARIITGEMAQIDLAWMQALVDGGVFKTWTYAGVHPYNIQPYSSIFEAYAALKAILPAGVPVATTEFGIPSPTPAFVEGFFADHDAMGCPIASLYEFKWTAGFDLDPQIDYGIVDANYNPLPAYAQAKASNQDD